MFEPYVRQLKSKDANERRRAIVALANTRSPAALKPLAAAFRNDPDPSLRELALKAGRYIREYPIELPPEQEAVGATSAVQPRQQAEITDRDRELAKGFLDSATTYHLEGDKGRALDNLGKALSLNPELSKETFVTNLVMSLTNMAVPDALPLLTHPDRRRDLVARVGGKRKLRRTQTHGKGAETATWDNVMIDFVLYALVVALAIIAILVFTVEALRDMIDSMPTTTVDSSDLDAIFDAGMMAMVILGGYAGISSALTLAMQGGAIHLAAVYILGGDGTLVYLYRRLVPFQTAIMLIMAAAFAGLVLVGNQTELWLLAPIALVGGSLYITYRMAVLIGEVYNFGAGSGCGAMLIGGFLLWIVTTFGNIAIMNMIAALFGTG